MHTDHGVNDDTMKSAFWKDDSESEFILEICQADYSAAIYRFLKGNWIYSGDRFFCSGNGIAFGLCDIQKHLAWFMTFEDKRPLSFLHSCMQEPVPMTVG